MAKRIFRPNDVLNFGKFKGQTLGEVLKTNPDYLRWCKENIDWFDYETSGTTPSITPKVSSDKKYILNKDKKYTAKETKLDSNSKPPTDGENVVF